MRTKRISEDQPVSVEVTLSTRSPPSPPVNTAHRLKVYRRSTGTFLSRTVSRPEPCQPLPSTSVGVAPSSPPHRHHRPPHTTRPTGLPPYPYQPTAAKQPNTSKKTPTAAGPTGPPHRHLPLHDGKAPKSHGRDDVPDVRTSPLGPVRDCKEQQNPFWRALEPQVSKGTFPTRGGPPDQINRSAFSLGYVPHPWGSARGDGGRVPRRRVHSPPVGVRPAWN